MTVHFLIRPNRKKAPRINMLRYVKDADGKGQHINLGTLPDDVGTASSIFADTLDEYEQYQLENYVKNLQFNMEHFETQADASERELIYFAPNFHEALFKLWKLAKENDLDFNPHEVMLTAILNKAKSVERNLNTKLKQPVNLLEEIGIDIHRFEKQEINKRLHTGSQALFKAMVGSGQSLEILTEKFNQLAVQNKKSAHLQPHYIKDYAKSPKRLPLWYSAIAIEILWSLNINPLKLITLEQTINAWLTLKKELLSPDEAADTFMKTFKPDLKKDEVRELIEERYKFIND